MYKLTPLLSFNLLAGKVSKNSPEIPLGKPLWQRSKNVDQEWKKMTGCQDKEDCDRSKLIPKIQVKPGE